HVGSYRTQTEYDENKGIEVVDVGGIQVAFLSYTYGTNGIPINDANTFCLNRFNTDYMAECSTLDEAKLKTELAHAESLGADAIAVMIHWGIEYQFTQNDYQNTVADFLIANGADIILGSHSHVPQPIQAEQTVTLPDGSTRTGFVSYSLGNFVSNQSPATVNVNYTDTTAVLNLEITKNFETGETTVTGVSYVPLLVLNRGAGAGDQYLILDVHKAMDAYESGDTSLVSANVYSKLQYALEGCHNILGAEYDIENTQSQPA
ncbi:MAG: CapA family protein, partial [Ruminiclostridium sp.]|nr:CapA family protein [Ruminiclostridium sp.]